MLIQIVDDSPNMRETIKSVLGALNAEFVESSDGEEAVEQYTSFRPDLVIMDIRMERTDGIQATRRIRDLSKDARVVVVTQYDDKDLRIAARDAGAASYILKDDLSKLLDYIQHTMEAQS